MKKFGWNSLIVGIHLFSQMKLYNIFRMKSETTNITINLQNWFQKFAILVIHLLSHMKF